MLITYLLHFPFMLFENNGLLSQIVQFQVFIKQAENGDYRR